MEQTKLHSSKLKSLFLPASLSCLLWGSAAPFIKLAYRLLEITETWSMSLFAGYRFILAGIFVILYGSIRTKHLCLPERQNWSKVLLLGLTLTFGQYFFNFIGVGHASGVNASIMNGSGSLIAIILACTLFRQEKITFRKMIGCACGFGGIIIMNFGGASSNVSFLGEGFLLIAAFSGAVGNCQSKIYAKAEDPITLTGWQFFTGGILLTVVSTICGGKIQLVSGAGIMCLIYLSFLSAAAYCIWNTLFKFHPISSVSVHGFLIPLFGVLISAILLNEYNQAFNPLTVIALIMVCLGIVVVNLKGRNHQ